MSTSADRAQPSVHAPSTADLSIQQLAHELNSLLDGARRCLGLAYRQLDGRAGTASAQANLELSRTALQRMTELLERVMDASPPQVDVLSCGATLREMLERIASLLEPEARQQEVTLQWSVHDSLAGEPAGLLEPLVVNGLRNALDATARRPTGLRRVEVSIAPHGVDAIELCVVDSGPGFDPAQAATTGGHGLGLGLCRRIVAELEGTIELANAPYDMGAVLRIVLPRTSGMVGST
jgi:C4-dicarboxylate-specific signal transduction histidine kinase